MLQVVFAPDYRAGVPYQDLLAKALQHHNVNVQFLAGYKRLLPLHRSLAARPFDLLHLHWPEAYYPRRGDMFDWLRSARFPSDLIGALKGRALATTAHNLLPHNRNSELFAVRNASYAHATARVIFAHSAAAKQRLVEHFVLPAAKVSVIPVGDLSIALGRPIAMTEARGKLGLAQGKIALIFGTVDPYKGLEEVIEWWLRARPDVKLAIVGRPCTSQYESQILKQIGEASNIIAFFDWLSDESLRLWLSAVDAVVFNYRDILTSGAACLARSYGVPILLPKRLVTVDLFEPTPYVRRFSEFVNDFEQQLMSVLTVPPDFDAASRWREACRWDNVAELTAQAYQRAIG